MQELAIIAHQGAGGGQGRKVLEETLAALGKRQIEPKVHISTYAGHSEILAQQLVQEPVIAVIGGDGTLHEVVASLAGHSQPPAILYLPAGRGNDFARAWQAKRSLTEALDQWQAGSRCQVPILRLQDQVSGQISYGINSLGIGVDAMVNQQSKALRLGRLLAKWHLGKLSYLVAVFASLPKLEAFEVSLSLDNQSPQLVSDCYLFSVLKNPYMGGGIKLDNLGQASNPEISVMAFHSIKARHLPGLIWRVLVSHQQDQSPQVSRWTGQKLDLDIKQAILGQVDGEVQEAAPRQLTIDWLTYPFILAEP